VGYYINPGGWPPQRPHISKEAFLSEFGIEETDLEKFADFGNAPQGMLPVVWVNNGPFTGAGIAYDARELDAFLLPDRRPKRFYYVEIKTLLQVSDLGRHPEFAGRAD
jgi:hypothetical protein